MLVSWHQWLSESFKNNWNLNEIWELQTMATLISSINYHIIPIVNAVVVSAARRSSCEIFTPHTHTHACVSLIRIACVCVCVNDNFLQLFTFELLLYCCNKEGKNHQQQLQYHQREAMQRKGAIATDLLQILWWESVCVFTIIVAEGWVLLYFNALLQFVRLYFDCCSPLSPDSCQPATHTRWQHTFVVSKFAYE